MLKDHIVKAHPQRAMPEELLAPEPSTSSYNVDSNDNDNQDDDEEEEMEVDPEELEESQVVVHESEQEDLADGEAVEWIKISLFYRAVAKINFTILKFV